MSVKDDSTEPTLKLSRSLEWKPKKTVVESEPKTEPKSTKNAIAARHRGGSSYRRKDRSKAYPPLSERGKTEATSLNTEVKPNTNEALPDVPFVDVSENGVSANNTNSGANTVDVADTDGNGTENKSKGFGAFFSKLGKKRETDIALPNAEDTLELDDGNDGEVKAALTSSKTRKLPPFQTTRQIATAMDVPEFIEDLDTDDMPEFMKDDKGSKKANNKPPKWSPVAKPKVKPPVIDEEAIDNWVSADKNYDDTPNVPSRRRRNRAHGNNNASDTPSTGEGFRRARKQQENKKGTVTFFGTTMPKKQLLVSLGVVGVTLLAGMGVGYTVYTKMFTGFVTVPVAQSVTLESMRDGEPCDPFKALGLDCRVDNTFDSKPNGTLLSQSIKPGEQVKQGEKIDLTYSMGAKETVMPNLKGLDVKEAKAILFESNLKISKVIEESPKDTYFKEGVIIGTDVKAGEAITNGSQVVVTVSDGKRVIPDYAGKTKEYVETDAKDKKLNVKFEEEESDSPAGIVIKQDNNEETGEVTVYISKHGEAKTLIVPDVIAKTKAEAQLTLAQAGFTKVTTIVVKNNDVATEQITQIVPAAGTEVQSDESIIIIDTVPNDTLPEVPAVPSAAPENPAPAEQAN